MKSRPFALLERLTGEERRALAYKYVTVPRVGRIDPDRIPEPPFPDREMTRLLKSGLAKVDKWLGGGARIQAEQKATGAVRRRGRVGEDGEHGQQSFRRQ